MRTYTAVFGAFVRMYAYHDFEAKTDKLAVAKAKAEFKKHSAEMGWDEMDTGNIALPSIVDLTRTVSYRGEHHRKVAEGVDFALNEDDGRDLVSREMLELLQDLEVHCQKRGENGLRRIDEGKALRMRIQAVLKKYKELCK